MAVFTLLGSVYGFGILFLHFTVYLYVSITSFSVLLVKSMSWNELSARLPICDFVVANINVVVVRSIGYPLSYFSILQSIGQFLMTSQILVEFCWDYTWVYLIFWRNAILEILSLSIHGMDISQQLFWRFQCAGLSCSCQVFLCKFIIIFKKILSENMVCMAFIIIELLWFFVTLNMICQ